jgi:hypothetical protein
MTPDVIVVDTAGDIDVIEVVGGAGPQGPPGPAGPASTVPGPTGPAGAPGPGVAPGGAVGHVLTKTATADYATGWAAPAAGGGGGVLPHTSLVAVPDTGYTPGLLYATIGRPGNTVLNHAAGLCMYMPVVFAHTATIKTLAIKTGSSGPAEARFWFGVYADSGSTSPGARVGSAELVLPASAGAGVKSVTGLSIPVTAGKLYWLSLTPNTAQNGSALWWHTAVPSMLIVRDQGPFLAESWNQSTGYVPPPATAGGAVDSGWGVPYLLYGV